jgi:hypothetical protein
LPDGFVESLQMREPSAPVVTEVIATFAANTIVQILAGAFRGRRGTVVSSTGKSTRLALDVFAGRSTIMSVQTADLAAVGE